MLIEVINQLPMKIIFPLFPFLLYSFLFFYSYFIFAIPHFFIISNIL
jgi:hypothetical protein